MQPCVESTAVLGCTSCQEQLISSKAGHQLQHGTREWPTGENLISKKGGRLFPANARNGLLARGLTARLTMAAGSICFDCPRIQIVHALPPPRRRPTLEQHRGLLTSMGQAGCLNCACVNPPGMVLYSLMRPYGGLAASVRTASRVEQGKALIAAGSPRLSCPDKQLTYVVAPVLQACGSAGCSARQVPRPRQQLWLGPRSRHAEATRAAQQCRS